MIPNAALAGGDSRFLIPRVTDHVQASAGLDDKCLLLT